jgi:hypothetical protein
MNKYRLPLLLFFFILCKITAQYAPDIKWQYIDTDYNRIIFPTTMESEGLRVAAMTEALNPIISDTMTPVYPYAYPIILSGNDMTCNGYVTVWPRRSVWYTFNGGTTMGTTDWYGQLAVHEGRHMMQFDRLNLSTGHGLFLWGGESWYALTLGCTPKWMFEGDAVYSETVNSYSGRGRLGSFFELSRALAWENKDYSYYKTILTSFKDATLSAYSLGYPMINWLEENYGPRAAEQLFTSQAELPLPLFGANRAVKKLTDHTPSQTYELLMKEIKAETKNLIESKGTLLEGKRLTPEHSVYTTYTNLISDGPDWYAYKWDLLNGGNLYRFSEEETRINGVVPSTRLDIRKGSVVWDSVRTSLSWTTRQESDIYLKEADSRPVKLTEGGRYYHPTLSPSGEKIAALESDISGKPRLVLLDRAGKILLKTDFPEEISYASWPAWENEDALVMLVQNRLGESLWRYEGGTFTPLMPFTTEDLCYPQPWKGGYFLTLDRYEGQEICYWKEGQLRRVTNTPFGATLPAVDKEGQRLLYVNREGSIGKSIRSLPLDETSWDGRTLTLNPLPMEDNLSAAFTGESEKTYEIHDYNPLELFSPVGWGVTSWDIDTDDLTIPFTILSSNPMQTLTWEGGLYYNTNEGTLGYGLDTELSLFLPNIVTDISLEKRIRNGQTINDLSASAGLTLPLGFYRGKDSLSLDLTGEFYYLNSWTDSASADWTGFTEELELNHSRSGGYRSLQNRFEEDLSLEILHSTDSEGIYRLTAGAYSLLPGLFPSHGTGFYAYYEDNPDLLTSQVSNVRGYDYDVAEEQIMVKAEYVMPLFYPDVALGGLFYLSRISTELFYDRQWTEDNWSETASSTGCQVLMDFFLFNLPIRIQGGVQFSWLIESGEPAVDVVITGYSIGG